MVKKVFSIITFVFSILALVAIALSTFWMVDAYNYINTLTSTSGIDYFLVGGIYRVFCCIAAFFGIITTAIHLKISINKPAKIVSIVFLTIFIIIFIVFGMVSLN